MLLTTQSMGENLKVFIEGYQADLNTIYDIEEENFKKTGNRDWSMIGDYVSNHRRFVYDVIVEDKRGDMIKSMKGYGVVKTYSVTPISRSEQFLQCKLENGDLYLVLKRVIPDVGSISIVINERSYYKSLVSKIRLGTNGYVVIKDSTGIILAHLRSSSGELM